MNIQQKRSQNFCAITMWCDMVQHFISVRDLKRDTIDSLLDKADIIQKKWPHDNPLHDKILGLLFFEPSTRTRMSFESAMLRLGGSCLNLGGPEVSSVSKGETLADTIRVINGYVDALVLRHPRIGAAQMACEFSHVPVINGGDGSGQHPSQTLIDLFTIRETMSLDNINIGMLGDLNYGRTTHSLAYALSKYQATIHTVSPEGLGFPYPVIHNLEQMGVNVISHPTIEEIITELDVLYVTRIQRERFPDAASYLHVASSYKVVPELFTDVRENLIVLHPLPRLDEIDPRVDDLPYARYFRQSENGIPVRMAMLQEVLL